MIMTIIRYVIQSSFYNSHLKIVTVCLNLRQFFEIERLIVLDCKVIEVLDLVTTLCHDRSNLGIYLVLIFLD
jgi:hypothetical protein